MQASMEYGHTPRHSLSKNIVGGRHVPEPFPLSLVSLAEPDENARPSP